MGIALALALLLLAAREATAAKYDVAQCGWHLGADADWADTTGGAKFRQDSWCVTPAGADPFDGAHMKSFTKGGPTVSGTRFARWHWQAPPTTGITRITGTWWHALHDGMEQRLGVDNSGGGFDPFLTASGTETNLHGFAVGFATPQPGFEDRLLCARAESKSCNIEADSWSAVRALTITVEDDTNPAAGVNGDLVGGGWKVGQRGFGFWGNDAGAGVHLGETMLDGNRVALFEYGCAKALIGSEWEGTKMQPCPTNAGGSAVVDTTHFSDGPHRLDHCEVDFAGNAACVAPLTVLIDNNPPAHPRNLAVAGGEGWRRVNDFDLGWANPDQGQASPIAAVRWRVTGPAGYDSGLRLNAGRDIASLNDVSVPRAGAYTLGLFLRDEAGNESPGSAVSVPLRLDDVPPSVAFDPAPDDGGLPEAVGAEITDAHSGPASGEITYRRLDRQDWTELPSKLAPTPAAADGARLTAALPADLDPGTYVFRAEVRDAAGNQSSTTRRADGTQMTVRVIPKPAPAVATGVGRAEPARSRASRAKTRIYARLGWRGRRGAELTVPFGAPSMLGGRLLDADGAGLAGRSLRVVSRPSRGALQRPRVDTVRTGPHGGFKLHLAAGTSRRIGISFPGEEHLDGARRSPLKLRVRGGIDLLASPHTLHTGDAVRFQGRVRTLGAPIPRRGKLVAIQYYESAARRWRPVLVLRTDHSGRFHGSYRFRYVSGTASIRLRAAALAEDRWPYAPGASHPVAIRVTG
jgi:hypothetical protein